MIRDKKRYPIEEVLSKIKPNVRKKESLVEFDGDRIKMNSHRYHLFATKGVRCVKCGLVGKFFAKEKTLPDERPHFNLYAVDENGNEVLMTKDHIIPKSRGGTNHISNYQTMCGPCNQAKGNLIEEEIIIRM